MAEYRSQAQPPKTAAYTAPENAATRTKAEYVAGARFNDDGSTTSPSALRGPGEAYDHEGGVEWGQARGVRSDGPVDETERKNTRYVEEGQFASGTDDDDARATVADGSQAEGRVADAVEAKHGTQREGSGTEEIGEQDFAGDLERKKAEQAEARKEVKRARKAGDDVDGGSGHKREVVGDESLVES